MNPDRIVWLDLETTGLDPAKGVILEAAAVVTDKQLNVIDQCSGVVGYHPDILNSLEIADVVREMHSANGLWWNVKLSRLNLSDVLADITELINETGAAKAPIGGSSVHYDVMWIRHHEPAFLENLHYRIIDASGLREGARCLGAVVESPAGSSQHRALDDCFRSIELAKEALLYGRGWQSVKLHLKAIVQAFR